MIYLRSSHALISPSVVLNISAMPRSVPSPVPSAVRSRDQQAWVRQETLQQELRQNRDNQQALARQDEELKRQNELVLAAQEQEVRQRLAAQEQEVRQRLAAQEQELRQRYQAEAQRLHDEHRVLEQQRAAIQVEELRNASATRQLEAMQAAIAAEKEQLDRQKSHFANSDEQSVVLHTRLQEQEHGLALRASLVASGQNRVRTLYIQCSTHKSFR
jgi:hypothetical protein